MKTLIYQTSYRCCQLTLLIALAGFWFHTSEMGATVFDKYSPQYVKAASGVTIFGGEAGLWTLWFLFRPQHVTLRRGRVRVSTWNKVLGLGLIGLMVLVPAELILRKIQTKVADQEDSEFHPFLQAVPKPTNGGTRHINGAGFRGEEINLAKPTDHYRIFVLGGSTVYCSRVDFEQSHCRVLEKLLREAYPALTIEIQNAGMHWHTSEHSLIKYVTQVQDFDPDMVIVFHGINDLCRSFSPPSYARPGFRADYGHYDGPVARMVQSHQGNLPLINSLAINSISSFFSRYCYSDFRHGRQVPERDLSEWPSLKPFRRNMRALARAVASDDIALVMATQASLYKEDRSDTEMAAMDLTNSICRDIDFRPSMSSMLHGMRAFNAASREIAAEFDAPLVDLDAAVPKTLKYFSDDVHYTPAGNQAVAEALARSIVESGLLEASHEGTTALPTGTQSTVTAKADQ